MNSKASLLQPEQIEQVILLIRGQRVMLDRDLAALYGMALKPKTSTKQSDAISAVFRPTSCFNSRWTRRKRVPVQGSKLEP